MKESGHKEITDKALRHIILQDIQLIRDGKARKTENISLDESLLQDALSRLNDLIGLDDVKEKINQLVEMVRYRSKQDDMITGQMNMHMILVGNPGTGKTTVARILADIFKALGVLEKGHMVETDRQGLVAGYVGQTAIKTAEVIERAMGGVLFIDEAYSLNKVGANNDFGDEAVQVLLKKMEDNRGAFFTIVAGYPDEMDRFLATNPGLRSRFDHHLHFPDFKRSELTEVANTFAKEKGYRFSTDAQEVLSEILSREYLQRDKHFGNARRVRQYVDEILKQQSIRLGKEHTALTSRYNVLVKKVDVDSAVKVMDKAYKHQRGTIGFK